MRKQYDDFTQLKLKDMSKTISDMTYKCSTCMSLRKDLGSGY